MSGSTPRSKPSTLGGAMTRREFAGSMAMGLLGLASGRRHSNAAPREMEKPNLVMIISDNLGRESVGTYGGTHFLTPRIDSIGTSGVVFDQCYIGTPLCCPARAGLYTGRYPPCMGIHGQPSPSNLNDGVPLEEITLAETLRAAGYRTAIFGKWNLGYDPGRLPTYQGFDTYYGVNAGNADYYTHLYHGEKYFYRDTTPIDPVGYLDNLCADEAVSYLESRRGDQNPFLVIMAFFTPHGPYQTPPGYPGGSTLDIYGQMIDNMDNNVGRILDKLDEIGVADNTLVIFISDQGGSYINGYGRSLSEGSLKVACHARWPGHTVAGARVNTPIVSYDWFTTFTVLGGGWPPSDRFICGKNVAHLFQGDGPCPHARFFWTYGEEDAVREGDWKLRLANGNPTGLYDLSTDPNETQDLSGVHPDLTQALRAKIVDWKTDMCPEPQTSGLRSWWMVY